MLSPEVLHAVIAVSLEKRTPLLQMTPDELLRTYVSPHRPCPISQGVLYESIGARLGRTDMKL